MARHPALRQSLPPIVIGIILLACTVTGLAAGVGVRQLVNGAGFGVTSGTGPGKQDNHATGSTGPDVTAPPAASPTVGGAGLPTVTASAQATGFQLSAQVSPTVVAAGQQFSVTVTVVAHDGRTPLEGVDCTLGPPPSGDDGPSLFTQWPRSAVSNSQGKAGWTLQAPSVHAGTYELQVQGTGTHGYFFYTLVFLTIS